MSYPKAILVAVA